MKTGVALLAVLAVFAVPSTANAGWRVDRATQIARVVWHNPCVDRMTIQWGPRPAGAEDASAWTWGAPECVIWFDQSQPLEWEPFCTLVLHEAGHLAGMGHTDHGIMSPDAVFERETSTVNGRTATTWAGTDQRCKDRGLRYLHAHDGAGTLK